MTILPRREGRVKKCNPILVINVGLNQFAKSLEAQDVEVVQVDWMPPAGGDKEMMNLLDQFL